MSQTEEPGERPTTGKGLLLTIGSILGYAATAFLLAQSVLRPFGLEERGLFVILVLAFGVGASVLIPWAVFRYFARQPKIGTVLFAGLVGAVASFIAGWSMQAGPPTGLSVHIIGLNTQLSPTVASLSVIQGFPLPQTPELGPKIKAVYEDVVIDFVNSAPLPRHVVTLGAILYLSSDSVQVQRASAGFALVSEHDSAVNLPISVPGNGIRRVRVRFVTPAGKLGSLTNPATEWPDLRYTVDSVMIVYRETLGPLHVVGPRSEGLPDWDEPTIVEARTARERRMAEKEMWLDPDSAWPHEPMTH